MLTLTIVSVLLVVVFASVLLFGVSRIMHEVETIGNSPTSTPGSLLAKVRWGVRAIESQTAALRPQAGWLNIALGRLERSLGALRQAVAGLSARPER